MSSDEPTGPRSPDEAPGAEETSDPTIQAEIDEKASIEEPSGAEAAPGGGDASQREPMPAPGAPDELSSDEAGTGAPGQDAEQEGDGDAGAPPVDRAAVEADPGAVTGAEATEPSTVPEQPGTSASPDPLAGPASDAAETEKDAEAAAAEKVAAEAEEPEIAEPAEVDELRQALVDTLRQHLGDGVVEHHIEPGVDVCVRVRTDAWRQAAEVARDHLNLQYFSFLSAIDWLPSPYGKSEDAGMGEPPPAAETSALEHGVTGGDTRMQVLARLHSVTRHVGLTLKADVPDDSPRIESWSSVYRGADWHERETWEMFGITFEGHPNLIHMYLPGAFEGHPLRKDFPLLAREVKPWPGLVDVEAMPGEEPESTPAGAEEG